MPHGRGAADLRTPPIGVPARLSWRKPRRADLSHPAPADIHPFDATLAAITKALKKGDVVTLIGFGTFKVSKRAARVGRNPQTGKELKIPARKAPTFKAGAALKAAVN